MLSNVARYDGNHSAHYSAGLRRTGTYVRIGGHDYGWEHGAPSVFIVERWVPVAALPEEQFGQ